MPKDNVIAFPKQSKFNFSIFVLLAVLVYMIVAIYSYFSKEHIVGYEVREGTMVEDNRYEAVVLREEKMVLSDAAGYLNFFVAEKERVGVGNLVYALDESGTMKDYLETSNRSENTLKSSDLDEFRNILDEFVKEYDKQDLGGLYQLSSTLENQTSKIANVRLLQDMEGMSSMQGLVQYHYAQNAGNVVYWKDGLENLTPAEVTTELLKKDNYTMEHISSNVLVAPGDFAYKLFDSEKWSVVFPVADAETAQRYLEEEVVKVRFLKNDISIWGNVSLAQNTLGETVVILEFQSSSINFATDRFVELEIEMEQERGLKIPVSAIAQKEFYLVPEAYVMYIESEDAYYINVESYMENGDKSIKMIEITPYSLKDGLYYLDDAAIAMGSRLVGDNMPEAYTISSKASLTGVYNMNKGYADFKQIRVKQQNDTYAIVESNTQYGLNTYDYIVLNASAVSDDDFLYE